MRKYPLLVFIALLLAGLAAASSPTAFFTSPTPASGILTNSTLLISYNFSLANVTGCKAQIGGVNYTGTVSGHSCNATYTLAQYQNVSVIGWLSVLNSTYSYYQDPPDAIANVSPDNNSHWTNFPYADDMNWSTPTTISWVSDKNGVIYFNYTTPSNVMGGAVGTSWIYSYGLGSNQTVTFTNTTCLSQPTVQIKFDINAANPQCYNGATWVNPTSTGSTGSFFYESTMAWKINTTGSAATYSTNETRSYCYLNCSSTVPPTITLISPANNNYTNNNNVTFTFSASDIAGGTMSCSMYVDGMGPPQTNTSVQENTPTSFTEGLADGRHYWNVNCTDQSNNSAVSSTNYFTVITSAPTIALSYPTNNAIFNASTFNFSFVASSTYSPTLSCYLYIDGTLAGSGTVPANATTSLPSPYLTGTHSWQVYCGDLAGNTASSSIWNFSVTQVIQPVAPANNSIINSGASVNLQYSFWTPTAANMTCTVYVDGSVVSTSTTQTPGGASVQNIWVPAGNGTHTWYVACVDENTNGTIVMPPSNFTIGAGVASDVTYSLTPNTNFVNVSTNITYTIASNLSILSYYGMNITYYDPNTGNTTQVFFQNVSNAPGGGTLQYEMDNNGTYYILAFFGEQGQQFVLPWAIQFGENQGIAAVAQQMQSNPPMSGFAWYFIGLCVAVLVAGFVSRFTVSGAGFAAIGVLWVFSLLYAGVPVVQVGTVPLDGIAITTFATVMVFAGAYLGWYG
jgi:hypothetical protein